jgi:hypothetical protein
MTESPVPQSPLAPTRQRFQTNKCTKRVRWTKEEDARLSRLLTPDTPPNWTEIFSHFPGKSPQQVTERWEKVLDPNLVKGSWRREEDATIIEFVRTHGCGDWSKLSELLPGRIGKQCRERWRNHLDPTLTHTPWTPQEDATLIELHRRHGNAWVRIAECMPGRSDNAVKNRWNSTLWKTFDAESMTQNEPPPSLLLFVNPVGFRTSPSTSPPLASVETNRAELLLLMGEVA